MMRSRFRYSLILGVVAALAGITLAPSRSGAESMTPVITTFPSASVPATESRETSGLQSAVQEPSQARPAGRGNRAQAAAPPRRSSHPFYVEFRSRHALSYGHTFMAYGRLGPDGRIATQTIIGLHPKGDDATWWTIGHVMWVPSEIGPSDGDLEEEYISARYRIDLTPEQYNQVVAYAKKLGRESPMWHAVLYNCNAFVARIAGFMGLKSPPALEYPADFINGMRTMNNETRTVTVLKEPEMNSASSN